MATIYNVTLVNGDEFTEDSFQAAARRVSEMVRSNCPVANSRRDFAYIEEEVEA